jgi:hypothetical protein
MENTFWRALAAGSLQALVLCAGIHGIRLSSGKELGHGTEF